MSIELTDAGWMRIAVWVVATYFARNLAWHCAMTREIDQKSDPLLWWVVKSIKNKSQCAKSSKLTIFRAGLGTAMFALAKPWSHQVQLHPTRAEKCAHDRKLHHTWRKLMMKRKQWLMKSLNFRTSTCISSCCRYRMLILNRKNRAPRFLLLALVRHSQLSVK